VLPGQEWHVSAEQAAKITQPVLFLTGTESLPIFGEVRDRLHAYLPQMEDDVMPGANHLLLSALMKFPRSEGLSLT
jgi:pimeloyl-ACP methyl ester carboxylesterase